MIEKLAMVAVGGAVGATLRYLASAQAARLLGHGFPWGTVFVNIVGSAIMGFVAVILLERLESGWGRYAPLLITGVLGGFTTFSAFSLDALYLIERGRTLAAAGYVGGSVVLSILGLWAGLGLARALFA